MRRMSDSIGAIELSANFIIVIVISSVIVIGGLALFFKMKNSAQQYVDTLDAQTEDNIKSVMLSSGGRVAAYPKDIALSSGKAQMVGVGLTNINAQETKFNINIDSVKYYTKENPQGEKLSDETGYTPADYYTMNSGDITIASGEQAVKGILIRMPKNAQNGQYVYSIVVYDDKGSQYGVMQVYVDNS